MEIAYQ
jgi:hypothetical protein